MRNRVSGSGPLTDPGIHSGSAVSDATTAPRIAVILVMDQVVSTHFFVTHGEAEAARVTSEHGDAVRRNVEALGGSVEGSTGDGYITSFGLATAALDAAVEIQRAAQRLSLRYPEPVEVRIGVAIGEVHHDGTDLRGWPFFQASRLCDAAPDGAILASRTLLDVAAGRIDHPLGAVHHLQLKGFDEPSEAVEVEWQRTTEADEVLLNPELAGRSATVGGSLEHGGTADRRGDRFGSTPPGHRRR